jgi:ABC-type sugar transport system ATPase subunit
LADVQLRGVSKTFPGGITAVDSVDLNILDGELFALVGPSGSGKSTLLRMIAGLETPSAGTISIGGRDITRLSPRDRDVAMVFQNPALYPHLSVFENLVFGLRARGVPRRQLKPVIGHVTDLLRLRDVLDRKPQTLSGGQKQRVALGRALARKPAVFLLDEPMSSLDPSLRKSIRSDLTLLHQDSRATMILVTHDQGEALALGDRVAVMNHGRLELAGRSIDAYERPPSIVVARLLGNPPTNLVDCTITRSDVGSMCVDVDHFPVAMFTPPDDEAWNFLVARHRVFLGLRPESVLWTTESEVGRDSSVCWLSERIPVFRSEYQGHETITSFPSAFVGRGLEARRSGRASVPPGTPCWIGFRLNDAVWFDGASGARLPIGHDGLAIADSPIAG